MARSDLPTARPAANGQPAGADGVALRITGLDAGYGKRGVLHGIDLSVHRGEVVAVLGHNGAGKTTLLRSILGLTSVTAGTVEVHGQPTQAGRPPGEVAMIPSERFVFPDLTIAENLALGARRARGHSGDAQRLALIEEMFPLLQERRTQRAGTLSGGQQRMVSLGMALLSAPRLLLLDEPSLGLAPALAQQVLTRVRQVVDDQGLTVVVLEQNVAAALTLADRATVLRGGRVIQEMPAQELAAMGAQRWWELF